jgi:tetratricopeptide (TPR) repeat protein
LKPDGTEVDRIIDLPEYGDQYLEFLDKAFRDDETPEALRRALEADPENLNIAFTLFKRHIQRGDLEGMVSSGRRILDREGTSAESAQEEADIFLATRYHIRTVLNRAGGQAMLRYFHRFPDVTFSQRAYRFLARHYARGPASQEAITFFLRAFQDYPDQNILKKRYLEYCATTRTYIEEALRLANHLKQQTGDGDTGLLRWTAALHMARGDTTPALHEYGPAFVSRFQQNARALHEYARFWVDQGCNLASAQEAVQKALNLVNRHQYWDTLASVNWQVGNHEEAIEAQKRAIALSQGVFTEYTDRLNRMIDALSE